MRYCSSCQQQRPIREFDLGAAQLSTTCSGCAHERLRTEDHRARSQRATQIAVLERRRRELIVALVNIDAEIVDVRARSSLLHTQVAALERRRRELIAALVKIDAEIADLRARPTPSRLVLDDGGEVDEAPFDDGGADLGNRTHDEIS